MKILLIQSLARHLAPIFPRGLGVLKWALSSRHDVFIYDPNIEDMGLVGIGDLFNGVSPDVVGISLRNIDTGQSMEPLSFFDDFLETVRAVKSAAGDAPIVAGGPGFSIFAREIMERCPEIDYGVFLEGEEALLDLVDNLSSPEDVRALFIRDGEEINFTGRRPFIDFGPEYLLNWEGDLKRYVNACRESAEPFFAIGVQTKRGCVFRCAHCTYPYLEGGFVRLRDPQTVVDEIEGLTHAGVTQFFMADSVFNLPPDHAMRICEEILHRGLKVEWSAYFRDDLIDEILVKTARDAGCRLFELSPDGCHPRALQLLQKDMDLEDILDAGRIMGQLTDVHVVYNFMIDGPWADEKTAKEEKAFLKELTGLCGKSLDGYPPNVTRIRIYPYTALRELALQDGTITPETDLLQPTFYSASSR